MFDHTAAAIADLIDDTLLFDVLDSIRRHIGMRWSVMEYPEIDYAGFRTGHAVQIAWIPDTRRAAVTYLGPGGRGLIYWTDATSPAEALARYIADGRGYSLVKVQ